MFNNLWAAWNNDQPPLWDINDMQHVVVDPGTEFTITLVPGLNVDFTGDAMTISYGPGSWASLEFFFTDLNPNTIIDSFPLTSSAVVPEAFNFTDHSRYVRFPSLSTGGGVMASFDFASHAVPIPAALWVSSYGLLGLVGVARRKKIA